MHTHIIERAHTHTFTYIKHTHTHTHIHAHTLQHSSYIRSPCLSHRAWDGDCIVTQRERAGETESEREK